MNLRIRELRSEDLEQLATWIQEPSTARWWGDETPESIRREYQRVVDGSDPTKAWIGTVNGEPVGFVQAYHLAEHPVWEKAVTEMAPHLGNWHLGGVDYLVAERWRRHGVASALVEHATTALLEEDCDGIVAVVQQANEASWKMLEGSGWHVETSGRIRSDDPADAGPAHLMLLGR